MQTKKLIGYITGSIIIFGIACLIIPEISRKITNMIYKASLKNDTDEDDWGPEIVKKTGDK